MKVSTSFLSSSSVNLTPSCKASNSRSKNAFLFLPIELKQEKLSALAFQEMTMMVWSWGFTVSDIRKWWWRCGPEDLLLQISGNFDEAVVLRIYCFWYQKMVMKMWSWGFTVSDNWKWWWGVVLRIYCFRYQEMMMNMWSWGLTVSDVGILWWRCGPEDLLFQISGNVDEFMVLIFYCFRHQEMVMECGTEDLLFQLSGNDDEGVVLRI